jgi:hypothetical protein
VGAAARLVRRRLGGELSTLNRRARGFRWRTGNPIANHRDQLAVGAKAFAQRSSCSRRPVLNHDQCYCQTRLKSSCSLITAHDASINAIGPSKAPPPSRIGRPSVKIPNGPKTAQLRHRGAASQRRITGDDRDRYFQRKSQIFRADAASGAG